MNIFKEYQGLKKEIYIISLCTVIDKFGALVGPMFTIILSTKLGFNATRIALWSLIYSLILFPLNLLGGKLADKVNKKLLINICDIASSIIYIMCGLFPLSEKVIVFYLIGSIIQEIEGPSYSVLMADFADSKDRERAYSLKYLSHNIGAALAPILGGVLIANHSGLLFLISGLSQLISIIIFDFNIKETKVYIDKENTYESIKDNTNIFFVLKENYIVTFFTIILALTFVCYHQFNYILPLDFANVYQDNGAIIYGSQCTTNCITVLVFTSIVTSLIKKLSSLDKMALAQGLEVIGYIIFVFFIKNIYLCYIATVIFTLGEIIATITSSPYSINRIPANYRGRFTAFSDTFISLTISLSGVIIGKCYDNIGSMYTWLIIIALEIITIFSFIILKKYDKKKYPNLY